MLPSSEWIEEHGVQARGKRELVKFLDGYELTRAEAMAAMCYACMGYFVDGRVDCKMDRSCPMYGYATYGTRKRKKRPVSAKQIEAMVEGRKRARDIGVG